MAAASALCRAFPGVDPADQSRMRFGLHSLPKVSLTPQRAKVIAAAEAGEGKKEKTGTQIFRFAKLRFGGKEEEEEEGENEAETGSTTPPQIWQQLLKNFNGVGGGGTQIVPVLGTRKLGVNARKRDPKSVFVAGATGQIGARIAQGLLRKGISVRGGVRDLFAAQQLAEFATQYGVISREEAKRLNAVEFDYKSVESIAKAIGGAAQVVVTIGPTEDGPKGKVSFEDACNVVEAAKLANVSNVVVVYEPGTGLEDANNNPIAGIASFFSDLFSKPVAISLSELLDKVVETDLPFTLLRSSPTDGTDNSPPTDVLDLRKLEPSMTSPLATISKGQLASVVVETLSNPTIAENKVIEVFANNALDAVQKPISEILSTIPVDGRRAALAEVRAKAAEEERERAEREAAAAAARAAAEEGKEAAREAARLEAEAAKLEAEEARLSSLAEKAQAQAAAAAAAAEGFASRMKQLAAGGGGGGGATTSLLATTNTTANIFAAVAPKSRRPPPSPKTKTKQVGTPSSSTKKQAQPSPPPPKPQTNTIFGGLFTQETIYVDD